MLRIDYIFLSFSSQGLLNKFLTLPQSPASAYCLLMAPYIVGLAAIKHSGVDATDQDLIPLW